jgi:plasmid maintenance system antidote protein VapI
VAAGDTMPTFRTRLSQVLADRGLSQTDLAEATEIPYAAVRRLVRDGRAAPLEYALRIARVLSVPVEEMFRIDDGNGIGDARPAAGVRRTRRRGRG